MLHSKKDWDKFPKNPSSESHHEPVEDADFIELPQEELISRLANMTPEDRKAFLEQIPEKNSLIRGKRAFIIQARQLGIKNIRRLADIFTKYNVQRYELNSKMYAKDVSNLKAVDLYETLVRVFNAEIRISQVAKELDSIILGTEAERLRRSYVNEIPEWTNLTVTLNSRRGEMFTMLEALIILAEQNDEEPLGWASETVYEDFVELIHQTSSLPSLTGFMLIFEQFSVISPAMFDRIHRKYLRADKDNGISMDIHLLFFSILVQTFRSLGNIKDMRHNSAIRMIRMLTDADTPGKIINYFTSLSQTDEFDQLQTLINIQEQYEVTGESWYSDLVKLILDDMTSREGVHIYTTDHLRKIFGKNTHPWDESKIIDIREWCSIIGIPKDYEKLHSIEITDLHADFKEVIIVGRKKDNLLFLQIIVIGDRDKITNMKLSDVSEVAVRSLDLAVNLDESNPQIFLHLLDEENIDSQLMGNCLDLIHRVFEEAKEFKLLKSVQTQKKFFESSSFVIPASKVKGPQQTQRAKHKRQKQSTYQKALGENVYESTEHDFVAEVNERLNRPRFVLPESVIQDLSQKFDRQQLKKIESKIEVANQGAGKVKPYPNFTDAPLPNKRVWALRFTRDIRILAQEGYEPGYAHVFDVKFKSEIE